MSDTAPAPGPAAEGGTTSTATGEAMQALQATIADLGLTPEQIKGRLEASRKWEDRAKSNADAAKRLAEVERSAMSEQERAVAEAAAAARAATLAEFGSALVDAEVKAAAAALTAAGRPVDADALLEGDTLNRAAFLGEDGKADAAKVAAWLDRVAPKATEAAEQQPSAPVWPDLGQGQRGPANKDMALNGDPLLRDVKAKLGIQ
jgi:glutathione S-transferase